MLEITISTLPEIDLNFGITLPIDTGPGPIKLIGGYNQENDQRGFFGEVSTSQLINGTSLASIINLTAGTAQNNTQPWLKFFLDDKILFIAKKTYRHSLSWDSLNTANVVLGNRIITIGSYQYRIRLLKGLGPNISSFSIGYDTRPTHGSEWNRLMYNVCEQPIDNQQWKKSQIGDNWANYTQSELGLVSAGSWCQETSPSYANGRIIRGYGGIAHMTHNDKWGVSSILNWRPVLELIP